MTTLFAKPPLKDPPARGSSRLLADKLRTAIVERGYSPGDRFPTRRQLVEQTGLGYATVARAMDMLASQGVIDQRRGEGTFIAGSADVAMREAIGVKRIGVVLPFWVSDGASPIVPQYLAGINDEADPARHQIELLTNHGDAAAEPAFVQQILDRRLDGLIWFVPALHHEANLARLLEHPPLKVVTTVRRFHRVPAPLVQEDVAEVGRLLAAHLKRRGCSQPVMVCRPPEQDAHSADLLEAVREALAAVGVDLPDERVCPAVGHARAEQLLNDHLDRLGLTPSGRPSRRPGFDAVFCLQASLLPALCDRRAAGQTFEVVQLWGDAADITRRLVGHGRAANRKVTVIETPVRAMGRQAIRTLDQQWRLANVEPLLLKPRLLRG